jgi:hypothetical protein
MWFFTLFLVSPRKSVIRKYEMQCWRMSSCCGECSPLFPSWDTQVILLLCKTVYAGVVCDLTMAISTETSEIPL